MSKSVDETVFDFFSTLLKEPQVSKAPTPVDTTLQQDTSPTTSVGSHLNVKQTQGEAGKDKPLTQRITPQPSVAAKAKPNVLTTSGTKGFAEPDVDKQSLEKLLSAVSAPKADVSHKTVNTASVEQQIIASAQKARQAITQPTQVQAAVLPAVASKEINSLVDNNTKEKQATQPKNAIIKSANKNAEASVATTQEASIDAGGEPPQVVYDLKDTLDDEFQVLFFNVAGLTLAVPLVSLGGIVKVERVNNIIGRPDWFMGVQTHRDGQINVVDSAAWVMPEKYSDDLAQSIEYQYLVMLDDSEWGLACESLVNAVKIDKSHVNWREKPGKRPWLAGVVKEQMCGILHVKALIQMLEAGLGCQDSIN